MIWVALAIANAAAFASFHHDAELAQANHEFQTAIAMTERGLEHSPHAPDLLAMSANLYRITGNFTRADHACDRLYRAASLSVGLACKTQIMLARGALNARQAQQRLHLLDKLPTAEDPHIRGWISSVKADLAIAADRPERAVDLLRQALALNVDRSVRQRLGSLLISMAKPEEALALTQSSDTEPALLLVRLKALRALGRHSEAVILGGAMHDEFQYALATSQHTHSREMAEFYFDIIPDPALARRLAILNWRIQKEPEDRVLLQRAIDHGSM